MSYLPMAMRLAGRRLRRRPVAALASALVLALGGGFSVSVFSIVNAAMFTALPFADPGQLVMIEEQHPQSICRPLCFAAIPARELPVLAHGAALLSGLGGLSTDQGVIGTPGGPSEAQWAVVSANFLALLGFNPAIGRNFLAEEDRPSTAPVVILSHAFWSQQFGADSSVVGRTLTIRKRQHQIIGVLSPAAVLGKPLFFGDTATAPFYVPIGAVLSEQPGAGFETVVGRLRPGATLEGLRSELDVVFAHREQAPPRPNASPNGPVKPRVTTLRRAHADMFGSPYLVVLGAAVALLLVACGNLAGLFLVRNMDARQEAAILAAIGADWYQLNGPFLVEAGLVVSAGLIGALGLASLASRLLGLVPPGSLPFWATVHIDWRTMAFGAGVSVVAMLAVGVMPSAIASHGRHHHSLRSEAGAQIARPVGRSLMALIGAQIAGSLILLTAAGLLIKTLITAATRDLGIAKASVVRVGINRQGAGFADETQERALIQSVQERLHLIAGVAMTSVGSRLDQPKGSAIGRDGPGNTIADPIPPEILSISPEYVEVVGLRLLAGRGFDANDAVGAEPIAIIDSRTARILFPRDNPIGGRISAGSPEAPTNWLRVVGVVGTTRNLLTNEEDRGATIYRPLRQALGPGFGLAVRTSGPAPRYVGDIRAAVQAVFPEAVLRVDTIDEVVDRRLAPLRLNAILAAAIGLAALLISVIGVYGAVQYGVGVRSTEIGIRLALGSTPQQIVGLVAASATRAALVGVGLGLAGSAVLTRFLEPWLHGISAADPLPFAGAAVFLAAAAVSAAVLPAMKAVQSPPAAALRSF